jgi:hypothetical protein
MQSRTTSRSFPCCAKSFCACGVGRTTSSSRRLEDCTIAHSCRAEALSVGAEVRKWPIASFRCDAEVDRYRGIADSQLGRFMGSRPNKTFVIVTSSDLLSHAQMDRLCKTIQKGRDQPPSLRPESYAAGNSAPHIAVVALHRPDEQHGNAATYHLYTTRCPKRGADVWPNFNWNRQPASMMGDGYR